MVASHSRRVPARWTASPLALIRIVLSLMMFTMLLGLFVDIDFVSASPLLPLIVGLVEFAHVRRIFVQRCVISRAPYDTVTFEAGYAAVPLNALAIAHRITVSVARFTCHVLFPKNDK